jgi:uncharacterized protein (UPF0332 family)
VLPHDLLVTALYLANSSKGKPRQAHLRRAVSTTYYGMFHALARCCADLLIGGTGSSRSAEAWNQVYRALGHSSVKDTCAKKKAVLAKFPQEIQDFANVFLQMQTKRDDADYNPHGTLFKSAVLIDIEIAQAAIDNFSKAPQKDRRAFAAFVMLKQRG